MNPEELLKQADKNIREETQAVVNMLYDDVRKKYISLVSEIDLTINLAYHFDYDESTEYNKKYYQIKNVFENKYFQEMLEQKFAGFFEFLTLKKTDCYFRLTIGHDPVKNIFKKLP